MLRVTSALMLSLAIFMETAPAFAFTCDDVRALSREEQNYWSKRLHLSSFQRHLIWVACYRDYRANQINALLR
jgi:hypothetical protein